MDFISLANINAINLASSGLINSPLSHHLVGHEILHVFYSVARGPRKLGLSRSKRRKLANRRRRRFTDNIVMHHKRLHDRNREIVISSAKTRALAKKLAAKQPSSAPDVRKWRDKVGGIKDRGAMIRGRVDARRMRARSRWLSVASTSQALSQSQELNR